MKIKTSFYFCLSFSTLWSFNSVLCTFAALRDFVLTFLIFLVKGARIYWNIIKQERGYFRIFSYSSSWNVQSSIGHSLPFFHLSFATAGHGELIISQKVIHHYKRLSHPRFQAQLDSFWMRTWNPNKLPPGKLRRRGKTLDKGVERDAALLLWQPPERKGWIVVVLVWSGRKKTKKKKHVM